MEMDPDAILQLLGFSDDKDMQLTALEHLCMTILQAQSRGYGGIDDFMSFCQPREFVPPLARIFMQPSTTPTLLEAAARALTYYNEVDETVSVHFSRTEGALKALCEHMKNVDLSGSDPNVKNFLEQSVKLLDLVSEIDPRSIYRAGGLETLFTTIMKHGSEFYQDTMKVALTLLTRLCVVLVPKDENSAQLSHYLSALLKNEAPKVAVAGVKCTTTVIMRYFKKEVDPTELVLNGGLLDGVLKVLISSIEDQSPSRDVMVLKHGTTFLGAMCYTTLKLAEGILTTDLILHFLKSLENKSTEIVEECSQMLTHLVVLTTYGFRGMKLTRSNTPNAARTLLGKHLVDKVMFTMLPVLSALCKKSLPGTIRQFMLLNLSRCFASVSAEQLKTICVENEQMTSDLLELMGIIFSSGEESLDLEHILHIIKVLLHRQGAVWTDLIIRYGYGDKIELIAKKAGPSTVMRKSEVVPAITVGLSEITSSTLTQTQTKKTEEKIIQLAEKVWRTYLAKENQKSRHAVLLFKELCCDIRTKVNAGLMVEQELIKRFIEFVLSDKLTIHELSRSDFTTTIHSIFTKADASVLQKLETSSKADVRLLIRKLVTILENVEQFSCNSTTKSTNSSDVVRALRSVIVMTVEYKDDDGEGVLLDKSAACVRMELMATIGQLRSFAMQHVRKSTPSAPSSSEANAPVLNPAASVSGGTLNADGDRESSEDSNMSEGEDHHFDEHDEYAMDMEIEEEYDEDEFIDDEEFDDEEEEVDEVDVEPLPPANPLSQNPPQLRIHSSRGHRLLDAMGMSLFGHSSGEGEEMDYELLLDMLQRGSAIDYNRDSSWPRNAIVRRDFQEMAVIHDSRVTGVQSTTNRVEDIPLRDIAKLCDMQASATPSSSSSTSDVSVHLALKITDKTGRKASFVQLDDDSSTLYAVVRNAVFGENDEKSHPTYVHDYSYTLLYSSRPLQLPILQLHDDRGSASFVNSPVKEILNALAGAYSNIGFSDAFVSDQITKKLKILLSNPLPVVAGALPEWCNVLISEYPFLFSYSTRVTHMKATSFGAARSVAWLQHTAGSSTASSALGTTVLLKEERINVARHIDLIACAFEIFGFHAKRKTTLSILFENEEGTGVGPTREFYGLLAHNFQRKDLALWFCDDGGSDVYIRQPGGLFPAPVPAGDTTNSKYFNLLGIILAKALQDGHLVDVPLSLPFFKILVNGGRCDDGLLSLDDLSVYYPTMADLLKQVEVYAKQRKRFGHRAKLMIQGSGYTCRIEDLGLVFAINAPSRHFSYESINLIPGGSQVELTRENAELYLEACKRLYLCDGIKAQFAALVEGFNGVFPIDSLRRFAPDELQQLICGDKNCEWTRDDLISNTAVSHGYNKDSPVFLHLVEVLLAMTAQEKRDFLQFATGCSTLPPGGFASLRPPLTVVKRVDCGDGSYPSVNTCMHYLKLPEYSSRKVLRERLLTAFKVEGFQMN